MQVPQATPYRSWYTIYTAPTVCLKVCLHTHIYMCTCCICYICRRQVYRMYSPLPISSVYLCFFYDYLFILLLPKFLLTVSGEVGGRGDVSARGYHRMLSPLSPLGILHLAPFGHLHSPPNYRQFSPAISECPRTSAPSCSFQSPPNPASHLLSSSQRSPLTVLRLKEEKGGPLLHLSPASTLSPSSLCPPPSSHSYLPLSPNGDRLEGVTSSIHNLRSTQGRPVTPAHTRS